MYSIRRKWLLYFILVLGILAGSMLSNALILCGTVSAGLILFMEYDEKRYLKNIRKREF